MQNLEAEASSASTSPLRLQELANDYPRLRPLIAMNPGAYPALVRWLASLDDAAVNVALAQRQAATGDAVPTSPQRVSVMGRNEAPAPTGRFQPVHGEAGPARMATQELTTAPRRSRGRTAMLIALVVLAAAVATLFYLFISGHGLGGQEPAETTSQPAPAPAPAEEEVTDEDVEVPIVFPAPDTALALEHFVSPSGNISCRLSAAGVTCTLYSHNFVDSEAATCGSGPLSLTVTADGAGLDCSSPQVPAGGATTLSYDNYAAFDGFACLSTQFGVSCWDTRSGAGFGVAREGYVIGSDDPISPADFPWN